MFNLKPNQEMKKDTEHHILEFELLRADHIKHGRLVDARKCTSTIKELINELDNKEMKKEIYFPKGAKSINFDLENGIATAVYEEEKPAFNNGVWYIGTEGYVCLCLDAKKGSNVGFDRSGEWCDKEDNMIDPELWKPADMQEVKKLLIKEAEKRIKIGCIINNGIVSDRVIDNLDFYFIRDCRKLAVKCNGLQTVLFDCNTGKWAEIVKKPIYINSYGTEFFEGDECYYIDFEHKSKIRKLKNINNDVTFESSLLRWSEIMTKKQCYQFLADNCKE